MVIDQIVVTEKFEKDVKKFRDRNLKERIDDTVKKITANPESGKPLGHELKGERTIRIAPYRLIYSVKGSSLILLRFEHRKSVYG